jgi:hypothetical protein
VDVCGLPNRDPVRACRDVPLAGSTVEAREQPALCGQGHPVRLARFQLDSLEAEEAHAGVTGRLDEVELRHVGAGTVARVGDGERRRDRLAALDLEVAVGEGRCS